MSAFTSIDQWVRVRTRRARAAVGLRIDCEYRARAGDLCRTALAIPPNGVRVRVVSAADELATYDTRSNQVNPGRRAQVTGRAMVAVAERVELDAALVGYWWFQKRDDHLYDRGAFVVPEMRGLRLAEQLLRAAAETAAPETDVYVTTSAANWSMRRLIERLSMPCIRISAGCTVPWFADATAYPTVALDIARKS